MANAGKLTIGVLPAVAFGFVPDAVNRFRKDHPRTSISINIQTSAKVEEWAQKLSKGASKAIKWTKAVMNIGLKQLLVSMVDAGFALETVSGRSKDHREAVSAFVARRKPNFTGH